MLASSLALAGNIVNIMDFHKHDSNSIMLARWVTRRTSSHILTATRAVAVKTETGVVIDMELPSDSDGSTARNVRRWRKTRGSETGTMENEEG